MLLSMTMLGLCLLIFSILFVYRVPTEEAYIVQNRSGKAELWQSGFHLSFPFWKRIQCRLSLQAQTLLFAPHPTRTRDNVALSAQASVRFFISDAQRFYEQVQAVPETVERLSQESLVASFAQSNLWESLYQSEHLEGLFQTELRRRAKAYGLEIVQAKIHTILAPENILDAMRHQARLSAPPLTPNSQKNSTFCPQQEGFMAPQRGFSFS